MLMTQSGWSHWSANVFYIMYCKWQEKVNTGPRRRGDTDVRTCHLLMDVPASVGILLWILRSVCVLWNKSTDLNHSLDSGFRTSNCPADYIWGPDLDLNLEPGSNLCFLTSVYWIMFVKSGEVICSIYFIHFFLHDGNWMNVYSGHPTAWGAHLSMQHDIQQDISEYRFNKVSLGLRPNPWTPLSYERAWDSSFREVLKYSSSPQRAMCVWLCITVFVLMIGQLFNCMW